MPYAGDVVGLFDGHFKIGGLPLTEGEAVSSPVFPRFRRGGEVVNTRIR